MSLVLMGCIQAICLETLGYEDRILIMFCRVDLLPFVLFNRNPFIFRNINDFAGEGARVVEEIHFLQM